MLNQAIILINDKQWNVYIVKCCTLTFPEMAMSNKFSMASGTYV